MERLTERFSNGQAAVYGCGGNCKYDYKYCESRLEDCPTISEIYEKLAEYEDLEEQGKLLKLPCAVGDDVWYISERVERQGRKKVEISFVDHGVVDNITLGDIMIPQITACNDENVWATFDGVEYFGKTVFLTKSAAEQALKELKGKEIERNVENIF